MTEEPSMTSASLGEVRGRPVGREFVCPLSSGFGTPTHIALPMFFPTTNRQGGEGMPAACGRPARRSLPGSGSASGFRNGPRCSGSARGDAETLPGIDPAAAPIASSGDDALVPQPSPGLLFGAGLITLLSQRRHQHAWSH
jgi:hypothetical protein